MSAFQALPPDPPATVYVYFSLNDKEKPSGYKAEWIRAGGKDIFKVIV